MEVSAEQLPGQDDAQPRHVRDAHAVEQLLRAIVHSQLLWGLSTHALTQQLALELVDLQRKAKSTSAARVAFHCMYV
jgi:hypothetical protein